MRQAFKLNFEGCNESIREPVILGVVTYTLIVLFILFVFRLSMFLCEFYGISTAAEPELVSDNSIQIRVKRIAN